MSSSSENYGETPSVCANVSQYNTYGLATQGFVWAAISSVSGDWGKGHVKKVNDVSPDIYGNVGVSSISSLDYSGELNQINSDLSVTIGGQGGHRILTDVDNDSIRSFVRSVSGEMRSNFDSVCSLIPSEATSSNQLADKSYVIERIKSDAPSYRGSWNKWSNVPTNADMYPPDHSGNRIPRTNDYIVVLDSSELSYYASVSYSIVGSTLAENVLTFEIGHVLTNSDIDVIYDAGIRNVLVYRRGTWRFIYSGNWSSVGKNGWNAEYEMSKIAFTESQWNAINSGITEGKLTSIQSASSNWDSVYTHFSMISSGLYNATFEIETTSANNRSVFTTVSSNSATWNQSTSSVGTSSLLWNDAFNEISATSANNRSVYSTVNGLSGKWEGVYSIVNSASGSWDDAFNEISATSANNRSVYDSFNSLSADWKLAVDEVKSTSANNRSAYSSLNAASASYNEATTEIQSTSANNRSVYASFNSVSSSYNEATTEIQSTSANNRSVYSSVYNTSGTWDGTSATVAASAPNWSSVYTSVLASSSKWNESEGSTKAYTDMIGTSALSTARIYSDFIASSALTSSKDYSDSIGRSSNIYSEFMASSALSTAKGYTDEKFGEANPMLQSVYGTVESASANWNGAFTEISSTSADIRSTISDVRDGKNRWDSVYSSTSSSSGKWNDVFTTVSSHSAMWDDGRGSREYTDFMATSALTTANRYSDSLFDSAIESAYEYSSFFATSALTTANEYTDSSVSTIYDEFKRYSDFTSASALSTANDYTDSKIISVSGDIRGYADFAASSALTSANLYTDFSAQSAVNEANKYTDSVAFAISCSLSAYSDFTAASALSTANIYSEFIASSALTAANGYCDTVSEEASSHAYNKSSSYTDSVSGRLNRTKTYSVAWNSTSGISECSSDFGEAVNGDVIIIKKQLFDGAVENFRFTSFTYCSGSWNPMNGDYDSKNVFFSENLTTTFDIGNVKVNPSTGNAVISSAGKNVNTVFNELFSVEKDPVVTFPYISSIETTGVGLYESGTITTPYVSISTVGGSYSYGPCSTSIIDSCSATFSGQTKVVNGITAFDNFTLTDDMSSYSDNRIITLKGHFCEDSVIPLTNLGNRSYESKILNGFTETVSSIAIMKSFRQSFFDTKTTRIGRGELTSLYIRNLGNKTGCYPTIDSEIKIPFEIGKISIIFAVPKNDLFKICVKDRNCMNIDVIDSFNFVELNVKDASNRNEIPYCVYYRNFAETNDCKNVYTVTFKE